LERGAGREVAMGMLKIGKDHGGYLWVNAAQVTAITVSPQYRTELWVSGRSEPFLVDIDVPHLVERINSELCSVL
jgi:hypothetical protein